MTESIAIAKLVKLKQNLIFDGIFYREGSILKRSEIPLSLRGSKYLTSPGDMSGEIGLVAEDYEVDQDVIFDDGMINPVVEEGVVFEEEQPIKPPKRFRG